MTLRSTSQLFKAVSDPNRIRILKMLQVRPLCVCEIRDVLQLATSTISKHLAILRDAGFIRDHKDAKWVEYSLNPALDAENAAILSVIQNTNFDDVVIEQDDKKISTVNRYTLCSVKEVN